MVSADMNVQYIYFWRY